MRSGAVPHGRAESVGAAPVYRGRPGACGYFGDCEGRVIGCPRGCRGHVRQSLFQQKNTWAISAMRACVANAIKPSAPTSESSGSVSRVEFLEQALGFAPPLIARGIAPHQYHAAAYALARRHQARQVRWLHCPSSTASPRAVPRLCLASSRVGCGLGEGAPAACGVAALS
jgi:hypothetical protein